MTDIQLYGTIAAAVVLAVLSNRRRRRAARKAARALGRALRAIWRAARWVWAKIRPAPRAPRELPTLPVPRDAQPRTVDRVVDGDTLYLTGDDRSTRLLSINAPERGRPGGTEATAWLRRWAPAGATILVATDPRQRGRPATDRYGRHLAYLWREDGTSINLAAVWEGIAAADVYDRTDTHRDVVERCQLAAQRDRRGIWADSHRSLPAA